MPASLTVMLQKSISVIEIRARRDRIVIYFAPIVCAHVSLNHFKPFSQRAEDLAVNLWRQFKILSDFRRQFFCFSSACVFRRKPLRQKRDIFFFGQSYFVMHKRVVNKPINNVADGSVDIIVQ